MAALLTFYARIHQAEAGELSTHIADLLPSWSIWQWITVGLAILVVVMAEGAYREYKRLTSHFDVVQMSAFEDDPRFDSAQRS